MSSSVETTLAARPALGRAHLSYLPQRPPIDLAFQDLTYTVQNGKSSKLILRGISGEFRSGQLTAILGPSGAGKSTLLNILAGYRATAATGQILANGEPRNLKQFRKLSRYIMQEDLLQPLITVQEAMRMAADLKLGSALENNKKKVVVEEIVQLLRLCKAKNTVTEKLSGGERKRLSIALELLNNPPVIFLDEPTTGLDDVASSTCVSLLKRVARGGRTVICSLHTPSARLFAEFDHVYVVSEGRCAYQGTSVGVVPFLNQLSLPCPKTYNPADFIIEVSSGEYGYHVDRMVTVIENGRNQSWREFGNDDPGREIEPMEIEQLNTGGIDEKHNYKHGSTGCQQFSVLLRRMFLQTLRNRDYLWLRIGLHMFLGFIIAMLFNNMGHDASKTINNFGFCFACIIAMLYTTMMPILLAFPSEVLLIKREYFNRWYGLRPYYAALIVSRTPATIFFSMIFLVITYPATDQPMELSRFVMFSTTCVLVALISESMGTVISSSLSVVNSVFTGPVVTVPLMLLSVYGMGSGDEPLPVIWKVARSFSYMRHGLEGLVAAIYGAPRDDLICPEHITYCEYKNVRQCIVLEQPGHLMNTDHRWLWTLATTEGYLQLQFTMYSFLCFLVSFLFKDVGNNGFRTLYNFGFCYGCTIAMMYINMMPILLAFPMTMKYLKREHFNHWYGLRPYYTALVVSRMPVTIFFSAMFILVTYYFTDQPLEADRMLMFLSICLMLALISETIGIVISSSLNVVNAVFTGPASVVPIMLLAVYGIGSGSAPVPLIWRIARACSFLRYGLEGLMAAVYSPPRDVIPCPEEADFCMFSKVPFFLEMMGMKDVSYWEAITVLIAMWMGLNFLAYYLIRQRLKPNKAFRMLRYLGQFIKQKMNNCQQS